MKGFFYRRPQSQKPSTLLLHNFYTLAVGWKTAKHNLRSPQGLESFRLATRKVKYAAIWALNDNQMALGGSQLAPFPILA